MSLQNVTSYKQHATFPFTHFVLHVFEVSRLCRSDCNPTMAQRCVNKNDNHASIHVLIHTPMVTTFDNNMESKFLQQDLHHHFTKQTNMNMCYI